MERKLKPLFIDWVGNGSNIFKKSFHVLFIRIHIRSKVSLPDVMFSLTFSSFESSGSSVNHLLSERNSKSLQIATSLLWALCHCLLLGKKACYTMKEIVTT